MENTIDSYVREALTSYTVIIVIALLLGATIVPAILSAPVDSGGTIAAVSIEGPISGSSADNVIQELRDVRTDGSIDAVVLRVDSGGGGVAASEAQYRAVKRLAAEKPVVTSVRGIAASGAYYTALPSEEIYVTPGGTVGSVGVRALVPKQSGAPQSLTTGPDKATFDRTDIQTRVETLKNSFIQSVQNERGDRITLERTELASAKTYGGATAVENGMADEIGGLETALAAAGDLAGVSDYTVEYRSTSAEIPLLLGGGGANSTKTATAAGPGVTPLGIERPQYLMMWGTVETAADYQEVRSDGSQ